MTSSVDVGASSQISWTGKFKQQQKRDEEDALYGVAAVARSQRPRPVDAGRISRIVADDENVYIAAMTDYVAKLTVPVCDREAVAEATSAAAAVRSGDDSINSRADSTEGSSRTSPLTLGELKAYCRRALTFSCYCFQPSRNTNNGEPSCSHAELIATSAEWVLQANALLIEEDHEFRTGVLAQWRGIMLDIAKNGTREERHFRMWDAERAREVVETLHVEQITGKQYLFQGSCRREVLSRDSVDDGDDSYLLLE